MSHERQTSNVYHRFLAQRVASRYVLAKGASLLPDFKKALAKLEEGDTAPLVSFCEKTLKLIFPQGDMNAASWYHGLGTGRRNAINSLQKEMRVFQMEASGLKEFPVLIASWVQRAGGWAKSLRTLELASEAGDEERVIAHGPFEIVPMPGVPKAKTDEAIAALDAATEKLRPKFPQVLYGKVFLSNHLKSGTAAWYVNTEDKFYLDINVTKRFDDVSTIIHELGHRYDHKFFKDKDLRKQFWDLSTRKVYEMVVFDEKLRKEVADEAVQLVKDRLLGKSGLSMSDMLVMWLKGPHIKGDARKLTTEFMNGKIDEKAYHTAMMGSGNAEMQTDKLLHGPIAVTPYGGKNPTENFAEGFMHYVLGMKLDPEIVAIFDQLK